MGLVKTRRLRTAEAATGEGGDEAADAQGQAETREQEAEAVIEDRNNLIGREFVHFKGGRYRLEGFAKDSETLEEMVVYRALYGEGGLWVRPARMFFESIERAGKTMKRFEILKGEPK